jgi:Fic family protein
MATKAAPIQAYSEPHQFEPLMPSKGLEELAQRTRAVVESAYRLQGAVHRSTRTALRDIVRSMNSYYSNRIEGQSTHPLNIDQALKKKFSDKPDIARRQRLALAHIEAEESLETACESEAQALSSAFLVRAHQDLYGRLSEADRLTDEGRLVEPGQLRSEDVMVYRHQPPAWESVPAFLARADQAYGRRWGFDRLLVAIACAHHRLVWTHPFLDGNGRAGRLQIHCAMHGLTDGLWSVNRGLARKRDDYYVKLSHADMSRQGGLDGRGNLSERMLLEWCTFFIEVCEDQVAFMTSMLDLDDLKDRLASLVLIRSEVTGASDYRREAVLPLHHVLAAGPVTRGDFIQMTGLAERTGRKLLSQLLKDGLLQSDTPKGEVRIGFPLDALNILLPNLYPEAAAKREE